MRTTTQPIRLVDKQIDPLASLQQGLNIPAHDTLHIGDLFLHVGDGVLFASLRGAVFNHQLLQLCVKATRPIALHAREVMALNGERLQKALLDLDEKAEGDAPAQ